METKFQTSFIPKKPLISQDNVRTHSSTSLLMIIGSTLFIISIAGAGFTYFAKSVLLKNQAKAAADLDANEKRFNITLIEELKKANTKIDLANKLISNHTSVSEIFSIIAGLTIDGVRFSNFEFSSSDTANGKAEKTYKVTMKGMANSFNSVAWQSDVFGKSSKYGTGKSLKNPVLSNLSVDTNGNVVFDFSAEFSASDISYANVLIPPQ